MARFAKSGDVLAFFQYPVEWLWRDDSSHELSGHGLNAWRGLLARLFDGLGGGAAAAAGGQPYGTLQSMELAPEPFAAPDDPLFSQQWHLNNSGQGGGTPGVDINVTGVWDDYTGRGVTLGVVDSGVQYTHPELAANYDTSRDWDAGQNDADPIAGASENHATAVSGTIAADAGNGTGVSGVAPDATVAVFRMDFGSGTEAQIADNLARQIDLDISNNSWGYNGFFYDNFDSANFQAAGAAIENAALNGRDGLGTIFVFAAGNARSAGQDVNYHSFANSPFTIAAAAIDNDGGIASFSTPGAAILVSAPGVGIVTTDRTGGSGYVSGDYVSISGTSFSAPNTAGVVALMLEANPALGARDVQEILAYSARQTDGGDPGWAINGADNWNGGGLHVSHDFGFGLIDGHAAVRLAETWQVGATFGNQVSVSASSSPNRAIIDNGSISDSITIAQGVEIDHVGVTLNIDHNRIGDLIVILTSPDGTESVLVNRPGKNPDFFFSGGTTQDDIHFDFYSTHHWGETGVGQWTLTVIDAAGGTAGTLQNWTLTLFGDPLSSDDLYVFTDEFSQVGGTDDVLGDSGGDDILNAAAVTSNSLIDLAPGATSTIDGKSFGIAAGTTIESAFGGDGDDRLFGNGAVNLLAGGRGDDSLYGGAGNDTLEGGAGDDDIYGGADTDRVLFSGNLGDYSIVDGAAKVIVTDLFLGDGDDGSDTIWEAEWLDFADQSVSIAAAAPPPPNEAPTDIALSNGTLDENAAGAVVGTLAAADPDAGDTHSFTVDDGRFEVVGSTLRLKAGVALNHETEGSVEVEVTATDQGGLEFAKSFTLTVADRNDAPETATPIADASADEDAPFVFDVSGSFDDEDLGNGDSLTYGATLLGGGALPAWLGLDPDSGLFSGTPGNDDVGELDVEVTATDESGATTSDVFRLTVGNTNDDPFVNQPIADQSLDQDTPLDFTLPAGAFGDDDLVHGDGLALSAALADGAALPAWLSFDPASGSFSGTPGAGDIGTITVRVTATDAAAASAFDDFDIRVDAVTVNAPPVVDQGIADQTTDEDDPFAFVVPADAFDDADVPLSDSLSYGATLSDGTALPGWLDFEPGTRSFSGTPGNDDVGTITVRVTATDESAESASTDFDLTVSNVNDAPELVGPIADGLANEDSPFALDISGNFTDVDLIHGDANVYTAALVGGGELPGWLTLDPDTGVFSGTPGNGDVGELDIVVTVTDLWEATASDSFRLSVGNANSAPQVTAPIADSTADEDQPFSYDISSSFGDDDLPNGDNLTFTATLLGGGALPLWLSLDSDTGVFTGTPDNGDLGELDIVVTARDQSDASTNDGFRLSVNNTNDAPFVENAIADQDAEQDSAFSFTLPADSFGDDDLIHGDSLSYGATLADGSALPAWLAFDPLTRSFSGTPGSGDVGSIAVRVTASDESAESSFDDFDITVAALAAGPVTLTGTNAGETLSAAGSSTPHIVEALGGNDTVIGGTADDLIYGGTGNDLMTGNAGRDSFVWQTGEGGSGGKNAGIEVTETITDFTVAPGDPGSNDALDLSGLLTTSDPTGSHLQFQVGSFGGDSDSDTRVLVDFNGQSGIFDSDFRPTLQIDLQDIDLFAAHGIAAGNHNALIDELLANGNLIA